MAIQFDNTNTGSITLASPASGTWSLTFPPAFGTTGQYLTTNGAGVLGYTSGGAATTITGFTSALNTSSPNATVNVSSLTPTAVSTEVGFAIVPRGSGSLLACIPDGTTTGGNARGTKSVDLQFAGQRSAATQVVGSNCARSAILGGYGNSISGFNTECVIAGGYFNTIDSLVASSFIGGGYSNQITGSPSFPCSAILGGRDNYIDTAEKSVLIFGGRGGTNHGNSGFTAVYSGNNFGLSTPRGQTQTRLQVLSGNPTSATYVDLVLTPASAATASSVNTTNLPAGYVMLCTGTVTGFKTTTFGIANWNVSALFKRATAGNIVLVGNSVTAKGTAGTVTNFNVQWAANTTTQTGVLQARANAAVVRYNCFMNTLDLKATF